MARETSSKPWRKYAAYPGQPEFLPGARLRASTWQDLREIVSDVEGSPGPLLNMRACGSHWAFSEAGLPSRHDQTNDPDERENPGALRLNRPVFDVLPWQLSAPAVSFFQDQAGVAFNPSILQTAEAVVHVEAGMKIAELYSFLDQESGHHLGQRFPQYQGPWAMPTLGGAGGQTVAGATQTGTHGGDVGLPPIVDAVVASTSSGRAAGTSGSRRPASRGATWWRRTSCSRPTRASRSPAATTCCTRPRWPAAASASSTWWS